MKTYVEKLLIHQRAVMDAWFLSIGEKPPIHPDDGIRDVIGFEYVFKGQSYYSQLEKLGHTSINFQKCPCRTPTKTSEKGNPS